MRGICQILPKLPLLLLIILSNCAHPREQLLKFYSIGKDIQRGADFEGDTIDHDLYIPPQAKSIAIILTQPRSHYRDILDGIRTYRRQQQDKATLRLQLLPGHRSARLTRAIHQRKVHGIITDLPRSEMRNFMAVCQDYHVPILYLGARRKEDAYLIRSIYPDPRRLVRKAVLEMQKRRFTNIALLGNTHSKRMLRYFRHYAAAAGLRTSSARYQRGDYDSMSSAVQKLFAVQEETIDTAEEGKTEVIYQQLQKFDAVFLPDDFKILKYFTKLFKYYMLEAMPVVGLHHWRTPQQLADENPLREGFYVDFIGSYATLPAGLSSDNAPDSLAAIKQVDQRLLGYRGIAWLVQAIDATRHAVRINLNQKFTQKWQQRLAQRFSQAQNNLWQPQVIEVDTQQHL